MKIFKSQSCEFRQLTTILCGLWSLLFQFLGCLSRRRMRAAVWIYLPVADFKFGFLYLSIFVRNCKAHEHQMIIIDFSRSIQTSEYSWSFDTRLSWDSDEFGDICPWIMSLNLETSIIIVISGVSSTLSLRMIVFCVFENRIFVFTSQLDCIIAWYNVEDLILRLLRWQWPLLRFCQSLTHSMNVTPSWSALSFHFVSANFTMWFVCDVFQLIKEYFMIFDRAYLVSLRATDPPWELGILINVGLFNAAESRDLLWHILVVLAW